MRFTSSSEKDPSSMTFDEVTKSTRGIYTMSRVVKRKIQKIKPAVKYNKIPLVDKKWTQLPKDLKEQIWEAVQMAYVVGEGGKKMVLSQQRVKFSDKLKESVMAAVREETKKMEARAKESVMEAVRAERDIMLKQFSQLIPNFDPNMLSKIPTTPITPIPPIPQ
ncbi:unnamed protein product [Prunus brigantina]